ncbi:hypothetical protein [Cellulomonas sp. S1-8]|uniref:hypothetical protein n=1 Tax=Cellulomonas sp. S1-8 TaxID=2904790 RepID=UPI002244D6F0|nr:hypothetical protein [Cellulomonas sp. S1-8]UZN03303.1 hypothetical protein OKX07_20000 [Cellulomonas sp. S1-8]
MTWWQTLIVAGVSGVIAPIFLWLQQNGQNRREAERHRAELEERSRATATAALERDREQRREAYLAALRTVSQFRATVAGRMTKIAQADLSDRIDLTTRDFWGSGQAPTVPAEAYGAALDAVTAAGLSADSDQMRAAVDYLREQLELMATSMTGTSQEVTWAAANWHDLQRATKQFAEAARVDLDAHRDAAV